MRFVVTGASSGIGAATAWRLAKPGNELILQAHTHRREAAKVAADLRAKGVETTLLHADFGTPDGGRRFAAEVLERWDRVDGVILNAGRYPRAAFREISDEALLDCFRTNVFAPFTIARDLVPALERSPHPRIVLVSSILAMAGSSHGAHYAAAKAALLGLTRSLARELAPAICVNAVAPGAIDTPLIVGDTPERRAERNRSIPLGRPGTPAEVAEAIAFLASPEASYLTGTTLQVDGGWLGA